MQTWDCLSGAFDRNGDNESNMKKNDVLFLTMAALPFLFLFAADQFLGADMGNALMRREPVYEVTNLATIMAEETGAVVEIENVKQDEPQEYIVQRGDSYWKIASERNVDLDSLIKYNQGKKLRPGGVIHIPPRNQKK